MAIGLSTRISDYTTQSIAFSSSVRFDKLQTVYAQHTVSGSIAFTVNATGAVSGYETIIALVANGVNVPTFSSAFKNVSGAYDNRIGVVNYISCKLVGADVLYSVFQEVELTTVVVPELPVLLSATGAGSSLIILTYDSTLNPLSIPAASAFTLNAGTVSGVSIVGQQVRLTLAAQSTSGLTVSYTAPAQNPLQDDSGLPAPTFTNQSVSGGEISQALVFSTRTANVIVGTAPNTYEMTGTVAYGTHHMLGDLKIPANQNGWVSFDHTSNSTSRNVILGFDAADTNKRYNFPGGEYDYGVNVDGVGRIIPVTNGVFGALLGRTVLVGENLRLRRTDGIISIDINNAGASWETLFSWPGTFTADIFINANFGLAHTLFSNPQIFGGVAK